MNNNGWIKLWRKSLNNDLYFKGPFDPFHAWVDLLMTADANGDVEAVITDLAGRWGWTWDRTSRFLKRLAKDEMISAETTRNQVRKQRGNARGIKIHIIKWKDFQGKNTERGNDCGNDEKSSAETARNLPLYIRKKEDKEGEKRAGARKGPADKIDWDAVINGGKQGDDT